MKLYISCFLALLLAITPCWGATYQPVDNSPATRASGNAAKKTPHVSKAATGGTRIYVSPSGKQRLFGTVELGRPLDTLPIWLDVLSRNRMDPIFQPERYFNKKTSWQEFRNNAANKSDMEKLRLVNAFWNAWPYHEDQVNWNKADYWAIPAQFLKKSGDCEDYSIIKYFTLKELGIDPHKMRLVVLRDTVRNLAHAVLAVEFDEDIYILDNLSNVVMSHRRLTNYLPQYSVNEFGRWAHILPKAKK